MKGQNGVGQHGPQQWGVQGTLVQLGKNVIHVVWKRRLSWCCYAHLNT